MDEYLGIDWDGDGLRRVLRAPKELAEIVLKGVRNGASLTDACAACGVSKSEVRRWLQEDANFRAALDAAKQVHGAVERLLTEASEPARKPPVPPNKRLAEAIEATRNECGEPGIATTWPRFCDKVRARAEVKSGARGWGDKTIERYIRGHPAV
jgi:hypothetical protein